MPHDYFQKKKLFSYFDHIPGGDDVCKDRTCAYMLPFAPFPLICYGT